MGDRIGVVGSINTDLVIKSNVLPEIGETVTGESFMISFGGKGANEAVSACRLGGSVNLLSCVGDDMFSKNSIAHLIDEGVHITAVKQIKGCAGGIANIVVSNKNNQIIVIPGANTNVDEKYIEEYTSRILECSIVGGQFEIPVNALLMVSRICKENNIKFVLNPSPIKEYPRELFDNANYVIVNELEIEEIEGFDKIDRYSILSKYPNKLILTEGKNGCCYHNGNEIVHIPAIDVSTIDTTGAGDTFLGSFMYGINKGLDIHQSLQLANICAGLKTTKMGAQTGMPTLQEVKNYITDNNIDIII